MPTDRSRALSPWLLTPIVVLLVVGAVWLWSGPREDVPLPGKDATPEQVVEAYTGAINARDFETSNVIYPDSQNDRFSGPFSIDLKRIERVEGNQITDAWVYFTADFSGGDGSLLDGYWGYVLERGDDGHWIIVDQGVI